LSVAAWFPIAPLGVANEPQVSASSIGALIDCLLDPRAAIGEEIQVLSRNAG
jgi:hypothetical protein